MDEQTNERASQYVDKIIQRIYETRHWASADVLLRECPKDILVDVAFILLHQIIVDEVAKEYWH